ncbi:group II intron maturase-specific domain-containing protein [Amycolatopsis sp. NPDC059090]|uniref:group II intron maturase-specific domain-containing protein n=1 Tax=Amycolatopsis sp. NPDC059090 TaxID=3346723 RepID=UPI0036723B01
MAHSAAPQPCGHKQYVYTCPAKNALLAICRKARAICRSTDQDKPLAVLLHRLNPVLRGWCEYFRPGVSSKTFGYLGHLAWGQVIKWLRRKHPHAGWKWLNRRYCNGAWRGWPQDGETTLLAPGSISTTRYRYRGAAIPSPWDHPPMAFRRALNEACGEPVAQ